MKKALTLVEMIISIAIMVLIMAVFVPQLKMINDSWASKQANAEVLQNARVLVYEVNRSLSSADRITDVSDSTETNGYIEFEDNTGTPYRMNIAANNYIEFGPVGNLSDLAGPVSQLKFTCYSKDNFTTPTTIADNIRFVKTEVIFPNPSLGQDMTLTASTYLRTNANSAISGLAGCWELDETSGLTAEDSCAEGNDGTLTNMAGDEWTAGRINGGLEMDGWNDYVAVGMSDFADEFTIMVWIKPDGKADINTIIANGEGGKEADGFKLFMNDWLSSDRSIIFESGNGTSGVKAFSYVDVITFGQWNHVAVTVDRLAGIAVIYRNAVDVTRTTSAKTDFKVSGDIEIGRMFNIDYYYFDGTLDDIRVYNRILTEHEIAAFAVAGVRYLGFTEAKAGSDTTSITIPTPSTDENDLLIAAVATDGNTSLTLTPPFGQGWNEIDIGSYMTEVSLGAWWKLADVSESPTHQFTWSGGEHAYGWMMRFSGHETAGPIGIYATGSDSSSTPTSPAVTTTIDNTLILRLGAFDENNITGDDPGMAGHNAVTMDSSSGIAAYQEFTEKKVSIADTSITIDTPSGTSAGDLLITAVVTDDNTSGSLSPPGGEGWSQISVAHQDTKVTLGVWWKNADASESGSHQFTWTGSQDAYGWMMRFTGHDPGSPVNAFSTGGGISNVPVSPSVTSTVDNCLILRIGGFDDDHMTVGNTGLSEHTDITMDRTEGGWDACSGGAGYKIISSGQSGIFNFWLTDTRSYRTVTIAIAPDSSGGSDSVSGGAGYVKQLFIGDSGTSSFALTASQGSQMITIGITPDPESICPLLP